MAFDGITTKCVVNELNRLLKGSKINRILQPNKNEIVLETYSNFNQEKRFVLINVSANICGIHLTTHLT